MPYWKLGVVLLGLLPLVSCGQKEVPVFEDEAAFLASFPAIQDRALRVEEASDGAEPRHAYALLYSPGEYEIQATINSILSHVGTDEGVKKRKQYWYRLSVSEPDAKGLSNYRLKVTRILLHKSVASEDMPHYAYHDSDEGSSKSGYPMFDDAMEVLTQQEVLLSVDLRGRVTISQATDWETSLSKLPQGLASTVKALTGNQPYHRGVIFPQRSYLPKAPVGQGALWYLSGKDDLGPFQTDHQTRCWFKTEQEFGFYRVATTKLSPIGENPMDMEPMELLMRAQLQSEPETETTSQGTVQFMPSGGVQRLESYEVSHTEGLPARSVKRQMVITITRL